MKRFVVFLLLTIILLMSFCHAEELVFDYKVLSDLEGYEYDKFEKSWSYYGAYSEEYSDAYIVIGLQARGDSTTVSEVVIYAWIRDENNREVIYEVNELMILADDTLITCSLLPLESSSSILITNTSKQLLKLLADAVEISFKLSWGTGSITLEPEKADVAEFVTAAHTIYNFDLVSYQDNELQSLTESLFPITIE